MNHSILTGVVLVFSFLSFSLASASGVGGQSSDWQRQIDHTYEEGKSIYKGRAPGAKKIDYCVDYEGTRVALKRQTIKQFKQGSIQKFANSLYDCANPDQLVGLTVAQSDFRYVLYYLNKRYRLKLTSESDT